MAKFANILRKDVVNLTLKESKVFCLEFLDFLSVLEFGASKYELSGWLKPNVKEAHFDARSRISSAFRHLAQVSVDLQSLDNESGLLHILHAQANLAMLYTRIVRNLKT